MESKNEKCKDCIYFEEPLFSLDCDSCVECSNFISHEEFTKDMDFWHGEPIQPEENKPQYFLIRWLINLFLQAFNDDMAAYFEGITTKPKGDKQKAHYNYYLPLFLQPFFLKEWCDQWRNGGYTGDDYAGHIYIKIFPFVYLKFRYQC